MSGAKIFQEEIMEKGTPFSAICLETKNASFVFLSEGEDQLGTLAIAIPQVRKIGSSPLSSVLLGEQNMTTARILAECLVEKMNKIALVSVFSKTCSEKEAGPIFLKLTEKLIGRREDEKRVHRSRLGGCKF